VKEQSHKNEMSAAIRGDFKRLRERGVAATLAPRDDDGLPEPVEIVPEHDEPVVTALAAAPEEPDATPEAVDEDAPRDDEPVVTVLVAPEEPDATPEAVEEDDPGDTDSPGFLSRLFGR
jgi:hypothetical protein